MVLAIISLVSFGWAFGSTVRAQGVFAGNPEIVRMTPSDGVPGQYVTIEGKNFGTNPGSVYFVRRGERIPADVTFPTQCDGNTWKDTYTIVRVPDRFEPGQYKIQLTRSDQKNSDEKTFIVTSGTPPPGICAVTPDNGPAGTQVRIYGSGFGTQKGRVVLGDADAVVADGAWNSSYIESSIPLFNVQSGRLRIVDANKTLSNSILFGVGRCTQASCGLGLSCCGDGSCRSVGACSDEKQACTYAWSFFTGDLKQYGEACERNEQCLSKACDAKKCIRGSKKEGEACDWDSECSEGQACDQKQCRLVARLVGQACQKKDDCLSGACNRNICTLGVRVFGAACESSQQCQSDNCMNGKCAQVKKPLVLEKRSAVGNAVPRNGVPSFTFNQKVDESSVASAISFTPPIDCAWEFRSIGSGDEAKTEARCVPKKPLDPRQEYTQTILPTIRSESGEILSSSTQSSFVTTTQFAELATISVFINSSSIQRTTDEFSCAKDTCPEDVNSGQSGNQHKYTVDARDAAGNLLSDITSITWAIEGQQTITLSSSQGSSIEITARPIKGNTTLRVRVRKGSKELTQIITIQSELCAEEPWRYTSTDYDFDLSYCRGATDVDLLPRLLDTPSCIKDQGSTECRSSALWEKELIFSFQDPESPTTVDTTNKDVIVLRVARNTVTSPTFSGNNASPVVWYQLHGQDGQRPAPRLVDNFQGVQDSAGVYVSAPGKDGKLYVYFLTTNIGASEKTLKVYNSLIDRWKLARSLSPDSDKALSIRRDVLRIADLSDISYFISRNGGYPSLDAGSYLKGQSTSAWPSWQGTLGNMLKVAMPVDPLSGNAPLGKCPEGYDAKTCWNEVQKKFAFDGVFGALRNVATHIYTYRSDAGKNFDVCARLENPPSTFGVATREGTIYCMSGGK